MPEIAVLFDVDNTLIKETKDVSQYYHEAIRSVYGPFIDDINLKDYEGLTTQQTVTRILSKNGMGTEEINQKMENFFEELPYAYFNAAGLNKLALIDGSRDLLSSLTKNGAVICIASGQLERIIKNMFERVAINFDGYFKFGIYGNSGVEPQEIISAAASKIQIEFKINKEKIFFVGSSPDMLAGAKAAGIKAVGVTTGKYSKEELKAANPDFVFNNLKEVQRILK